MAKAKPKAAKPAVTEGDNFPSIKGLQVSMRPTAALIPYGNNARTHSPEQIDILCKSLTEFGWTNPILVDGENGVVAGHGRLMAAQKLGYAEVPCIELAHLTPAQRRAYVIADNQTALRAGWDLATLRLELGALQGEGFNLEPLGFSVEELGAILAPAGTQGLTDPDAVPETPETPTSIPGDLWALGRHWLLCGDSTSADNTAKVQRGARADLCLTDPPYGLGDTTSAKNNYRTHEDTKDNLVAIVAGFFPLARANADCIVLTPGNANQRLYPSPTWTMAWFTPAGTGSGPWGFCCWQPIMCYGKDPKLSSGKGRHPDAIVHTESAEKSAHPCPKPINFWKWLMERTSEAGSIIYEPFSGSGTTIIAAEMTGRTCHAIELDPAYVDVAIQRWQSFVGQKATLVDDGRTFEEIGRERLKKAA